ncbi:MAG TPA: DNA repair protein RadA, partial [Chloroflexota bacterium]|nr:DNA repair protein RadA [Chloroflexota bacterium]
MPQRQTTAYVCRDCGSSTPKWAGRCPECGEWDTLDEVKTRKRRGVRSAQPLAAAEPIPLHAVDSADYPRLRFGMPEVERVLGGGLVPGSLALLGGDPGIGKSTLLAHVSGGLADKDRPVLYVSGEESPHQIKLRADRLNLSGRNLLLLPEVSVDAVLEHARTQPPAMLVIDSIQTAMVDGIASAPGSVSQVREAASRLLRFAKETRVPVVIAGHVTKEGTIAGPRMLEHLVDAVLYLEGDPYSAWRILRSVKNRFGPTHEVAVLEMSASGFVEIANPSAAFLSERREATPGSAVAVAIEGTRALMVEVQALVNRTVYSLPKRVVNGYDSNRLNMMVAVLDRRAGIRLQDQDIYVNVVGGLSLAEPAADLPVALAIASSLWNKPLRKGT